MVVEKGWDGVHKWCWCKAIWGYVGKWLLSMCDAGITPSMRGGESL